MSWLPILALAALAFLVAAYALRLPRGGYALFGAALLFGLTGYALQGSPGQGAAPKPPIAETAQTGELIIEARREFFSDGDLPSRFVVTADGYTRSGKYADAAGFLRNALRENPGDLEAWLALGNVLVEHAGGQLTPAALYAYSRAERLEPSHPGGRYFYGLALLRAGQPGETYAVWSQLLEAAPEEAEWRPALEQRLARLETIIERMPRE